MLLSRRLPPHFLLPAWSTRQLMVCLQRAHKSTSISKPPRERPRLKPRKPTLSNSGDALHIHFYDSSKGPIGRKITIRRRIALQQTKPSSLRLDDEESRKKASSSQSESSTVPIGRPLGRTRQWASLRGSLKEQQVHDNTAIAAPALQNAASSQTEDERSNNDSSLVWNSIGMEGGIHKAQREQTKSWISSASEEAAARSPGSVGLEQTEPKESVRKDDRSHNTTTSGPSERTVSANPPIEVEPTRIDNTKPQRTKPITSLFDELFPEERKFAKQSETKIVEKLPAFEWHDGPKIDWEATVEKASEERKNWFHTEPTSKSHLMSRRTRNNHLSVLVLSGASKTLEESDFFRLGSKGEHIEGWTSGIIKVIQGRDVHTLEPLGHYFLVFSNEAAASAYLDNTRRLHTLSKTHGNGGSLVPPPAKYLRPGEDLKTVLRGYSLVPGQSRLSLRLLNRPHSPAVAQILRDGGPAAIARQKTNSENMVLLSTDFGQISHFELQAAISGDGHERNLHWKFIDGEGAIVKVNSDQQGEEDESEESRFNGLHRRRNTRSQSRYILSFKDSYEARRFVREWHRRPLPLRMEKKVSDEPPPMINAEIFW